MNEKKCLILLVGEQPAPNLLPTRHIQPELAVLVHTDRTNKIADNLKEVLKTCCDCLLCEVVPYEIPTILDKLHSFIKEHLKDYSIVFNLTGGTKPMSIASFELAKVLKSPFVYFQTEGNHSLLYSYNFSDQRLAFQEKVEIKKTIELKDYLGLYLENYETGQPCNDMEAQIGDALLNSSKIDEVLFSLRPKGLEALEIDFIVRCGNQVGVGEIKSKGNKEGIDQLNSVAEQRYLGTYIQKFLISAKPLHHNNINLAKAYRIEVIEVPSFEHDGRLSEKDKLYLLERINKRLGVR